jgi:DNA polymerase-3 subunit epsilon
MTEKLVVYDFETTGVDHQLHGVHQLSGAIVIDGIIKEYFNFHIKPHAKAVIDAKALEIGGITKEQVMAYPLESEIYPQIITLLSKYVDRFNKKDKFQY